MPAEDVDFVGCATALVVRWEVSGQKRYTRDLQGVIWAQGNSGPTWSIGYDGGYQTRFTVSGYQPSTLINLLAAEHDGAPPPRLGLVIGLVTNNRDPDGLCRVRLKFPWLSDQEEGWWARVLSPGGGANRGMQWMPEVNDEVLVGFESGDVRQPVVLGGLYGQKFGIPT